MTRKIPTIYGDQKKIRRSVMHRQSMKKKWDKHCQFSLDNDGLTFFGQSANATQDNYVRLLDEGVIVDSDDYVYAVIKKGTVKKWFDNLSDNFVGRIDKDHCTSIELGSFTKKDLRLVECGNGRYAVDVNVSLDKELYATKDLLRANNRFAISAELRSKVNEYITYTKATGEKLSDDEQDYLVPVIEDIEIEGYAVVASPKNANSYDEDLLVNASAEEGNPMSKKEIEALEAAEEQKVEEVEETQEETQEENLEAEQPAQADNSTEETEDEAKDGESEEETEGEGEQPESPEDEEQFDAADEVAKAIESLKAEIAAKDAKIAELEQKFAAQTQKEANLNEKLAKLLNFSTENPTEAEGAEMTSGKEKEEDAYGAALSEAFKSL